MIDSEISAMDFDEFRKKSGKAYSIGDLAAEIAFAAGFPVPASSGGRTAPEFAELVQSRFGEARAEKFLICVTESFCTPGNDIFDLVLSGSGIVPCTNAGACATLLTGASPSVHRVLDENCQRLDRVQNIFDIMQKDRKIALLNLNESAPDSLFRWRLIEYYSMRSAEIIHHTVKSLVKEDVLDGIVCFMGKESPEIARMRFAVLAAAADEYWKKYHTLLVRVSGSEEGPFTVHGFRLRAGGKPHGS